MGFWPEDDDHVWNDPGKVEDPDPYGNTDGVRTWKTHIPPEGLRKYTRMWAGKAKGKPCKCATCDEVMDCMQKMKDEWNKKNYQLFGQNCNHFVLDVEQSCCIEEEE